MKFEDWQILKFETLDSTNDKALELSTDASGCYVVTAKTQTAGRGRRGRIWQSLQGNLFFSLLLEFDMKNIGELVIISAISLYQSVKQINPCADLLFKWPNDVLLNGAKVCGILLEKAAENYMIVGIGVNIEQSPKNNDLLYRATSLKEEGIDIKSEEFLTLYLHTFCNNINILKNKGFESLRLFWNKNAKGIGTKIEIHQEKGNLLGIFKGINEKAELLLEKNNEISRVTFGDVFYKE
ncbi:MAG: biotin--[Alphaproteobacteria bacterium]|nr:biotin--[acetyl-CoA-carboxylase] ligase [Alphaproteobacteria bacterium]